MDNPRLDQYLATITARMKTVPAEQRDQEVEEMRQHLEALVAGHSALGRSEDAAVEAAIRQFGRAEQVGRGLERTWQRSRPRSLWAPALIYLVSALLIFGFFATANDKPTDFPYDLGDQILLAIILPCGVLIKTVIDRWSTRSASQQG